MKSNESLVKQTSDYYIYTPSLTAKQCFFYPLVTGTFFYENGYSLNRSSYDSFLIIEIKTGKLEFNINSKNFTAKTGDIIFINCYEKHSYKALLDSEILWLHFDGILAKQYFDIITNGENFIFRSSKTTAISHILKKIYNKFKNNETIKEAPVSLDITTMLTELIKHSENESENVKSKTSVENAIIYITEHLSENITLEQLAENSALSVYYFIRLFKKETGFSPHSYIVNCRINMAKFLLINTDYSVKEICFKCGFSCESSFSTTFKKYEKISPSNFRDNNTI